MTTTETIRTPQFAFRNVLLIGYRGTGKTTVGRLLAERLQWAFVDADEEVERRAGKTIAEIFADDGETAFRDQEQQVIAELTKRQQHVISLGGGAILRDANRQAIRDAGTVIWLTASAATIHERINADTTTVERRPNLTQVGGLAEIQQLLTEREPHYQACADFEVETQSNTLGEVVDEIVERLREME